MIRVYVHEFIKISSLLKQHGCKEKRGCLFVEQHLLHTLLEEKKYERTKVKLKIWKNLKWIRTDEGHLTKRMYDRETKSYKRVYVIDLSIMIQLQEIQDSG